MLLTLAGLLSAYVVKRRVYDRYVRWLNRAEGAALSGSQERVLLRGVESALEEEKRRRSAGKVKVDAVFFARLQALIRIVLPSVRSK